MTDAAQTTETTRFRVLALDGGGIRGAFSAAVLAAFDEDLRRDHPDGPALVDHFDLVTGTSTGGLLALGLGLGLPASELVDFYRRDGSTIFPLTGLVERITGTVRQLFSTKYGSDDLRGALTRVFGQRRLGESSARLVIPAYDLTNGRVFVFKTAHHDRFRYDIDATAVDIGLCTAAAPTYFPAKELPAHVDNLYVDGGMWANNPSLVGLTEAVRFLGRDPAEVDILNIGTTTTVPDFSDRDDAGAGEWNVGLVDLLMTAQEQTAVAVASNLAGGFHRVDAVVPDDWAAMDSTAKLDALIARGRAEAVKREHTDVVRQVFLNGRATPPFEPVHAVRA